MKRVLKEQSVKGHMIRTLSSMCISLMGAIRKAHEDVQMVVETLYNHCSGS
ncbi:hypothetical protein HanRHA438_Chr03g0099241 [Helianthus annuus]|uniref:Uncharacterized protein n=1 Tax=Helianthus annuus TaxID=4232 RepID=A0A9K3NV51_HELAN|nr:hypothetical protein HanXRQr2_Chr03g0088131 [Helianthus annuus]KAJ0606412.1 hypothetical protein HanHA89_Chr03g0084821 [Helianthus annuus]KAJ0766496.1 hypothetical protein HanLR1_Chr03g0078251 [Helianthus annuus]KAJ0772398.1 hypothetical protein HanOQP8_Chr03g0086871 [Helianthus annuus]KAJ0826636.1 hypothetical protein HanRHA438_Chr17g0816511 [Helianthus annuus]